MFGAGGGTSSYREVEDTDLIVLWGSNARETHPIFFHHLLKAVNKGARLYAIDPRRTSSAEWADSWLGLDVGSDIALANAVAREIIAAGLENREFIDQMIADGPQPERLRRYEIDAHYLGIFGVVPHRGRGIQEADTVEGAPRVVVISYGYWLSRFAGKDDAMQRDDWYTSARDPDSLEPADRVGTIAGQRALRHGLLGALSGA